jgi:hypothetical protein
VTFAADLLSGRRVVVGGGGSPATVAAERLSALGATVHRLPAGVLADEEGAAGWARDRAPLHALVVDTADTFASGGGDALRATLEHAWRAARAVATGALIDPPAPGRLLFIAPRPGAGRHSAAVRAALENLARTLSVEWARHEITAVALWPGEPTSDAEPAELTCYLISPAGGYFSGCRLELGRVPVRAR